jgi:hypothetical protein
MANASNDRERMRNDLRELAKLAKPAGSSPASHRFDTADSSGYVDLSAFSAKDPAWVDRELARAKGGSPPPLPKSKGRAIDALSPESMAPVSIESFLAADETSPGRARRGRRALYAVLAAASIVGVGALAVVVSRNAPPPSQAPKTEVAAAAAPPPVDPTPTPAAAPTETPASTETPAPAPAADTTASQTTATAPKSSPSSAATAAKKKTAPAARAHVAAAAPAPAPAAPKAAAMKPVVIPQSRSKSSGDPLMDAIRNSVAKGK